MKTVDTGYCIICGHSSSIEIQDHEMRPVREWLEIRHSRPTEAPFIQDKLHFLSPDQRESLLTGIHSKCFDAGFKDLND